MLILFWQKALKPLGVVGLWIMFGSSSLNVTEKPSSICSKYHLHYTFNIKYKKSVLFISASSDDNPVCVLHVDLDSGNYGNTKLFRENVDKWTKLQQSLNALNKSQKKTIYENTLETLGRSFKCNYGYHTKYNKNFTVASVSRSTKPSTSTVSTRSKVPLNRATQKNECSRSNILPNLCIFCAKGRTKYKGNIIDIGKCEK